VRHTKVSCSNAKSVCDNVKSVTHQCNCSNVNQCATHNQCDKVSTVLILKSVCDNVKSVCDNVKSVCDNKNRYNVSCSNAKSVRDNVKSVCDNAKSVCDNKTACYIAALNQISVRHTEVMLPNANQCATHQSGLSLTSATDRS
jgi:hypothetical protein